MANFQKAGEFLPEGVDGKMPLAEVSIEDIMRVAAAISGSRRWQGVSKGKKKEHSKAMIKARFEGMTPEQIKAVRAKAAKAGWIKRRENE